MRYAEHHDSVRVRQIEVRQVCIQARLLAILAYNLYALWKLLISDYVTVVSIAVLDKSVTVYLASCEKEYHIFCSPSTL